MSRCPRGRLIARRAARPSQVEGGVSYAVGGIRGSMRAFLGGEPRARLAGSGCIVCGVYAVNGVGGMSESARES